MYFVFFFQAEDGIRDYKVTGVQTCALPISARPAGSAAALDALLDRLEPHRRRPHRAARGVSRSTPPEPGCGAGPAAGTSRVPLDGGVRAAADLVRREPARRRR